MEATAAILHADLDAFYASVEQLIDPSLHGRPIAVGGGVVLAASYEARAFGVRSGMPGRRARELCPEIIFVGGHFNEYKRLGDAAIHVLSDFTPAVERISIDEAFADVSGCEQLFGPPGEIAKAIRSRVRTELGLPISIGVARTKHLAKIASQVAKPDGLVIVDPDRRARIPARPASGADVGRGSRHASPPRRDGREDDRSIGAELSQIGGATAWPRNRKKIDGARVEPRSAGNSDHRRAHSAGAQSALGRKPAVERVFRPVLNHLADRIAGRLRAKARPGRTVTVRVRFADLRSVTRSLTLPAPISTTTALAEIAVQLVRGVLADHSDERRSRCWRSPFRISVTIPCCNWSCPLGLRMKGIVREPGKGMKRLRADHAIDAIRNRFGWEAVGYASSALRIAPSVPDEFRSLAEKEL
jgi:DNA polymerase-4